MRQQGTNLVSFPGPAHQSGVQYVCMSEPRSIFDMKQHFVSRSICKQDQMAIADEGVKDNGIFSDTKRGTVAILFLEPL